MKILAVADEVSKKYYDHYDQELFRDIDLIVSCGDLPREYLEFLVTMADCPLIYVHGNHDESYVSRPPEGCICIEDKIFEYNGIRFLGLGGSYKYRPDGTFMYTEKEMQLRLIRVLFPLLRKKGFDVLVTHAPPRGCGDLETLPHRGFLCFLRLMDRFSPKYVIHGHVHRNYGWKLPSVSSYHNTTIINAFRYQLIEIDGGCD